MQFSTLTKKKKMIILINEEKALDKIQHPFIIKTQQTGIQRKLLQLDKGHLPTANNILNGERLNFSP